MRRGGWGSVWSATARRTVRTGGRPNRHSLPPPPNWGRGVTPASLSTSAPMASGLWAPPLWAGTPRAPGAPTPRAEPPSGGGGGAHIRVLARFRPPHEAFSAEDAPWEMEGPTTIAERFITGGGAFGGGGGGGSSRPASAAGGAAADGSSSSSSGGAPLASASQGVAPSSSSRSTSLSFECDHVFGAECSTASLYESHLRDVVTGVLEGYPAAVIAYGTTGVWGGQDGRRMGGGPSSLSSSSCLSVCAR